MSAMNANSFGTVVRKTPAADEANPDPPLDAAWIVLEAANDLGDHVTVEACRRVIDANLNGRSASTYDQNVIINYFR
jgi:hypothetical protein